MLPFKNLFLAAACLLQVSAQAQMLVQRNDIPVKRINQSDMLNPWTGGLHATQVSAWDYDLDGLEDDLFVFDKAGDRILVFQGEDLNGERIYHFVPGAAGIFPQLTDWALLRDYDCDGHRDIFTYSPAGGAFAVYRNTAGSGVPGFQLVTNTIISLYNFPGASFPTNIYVSSQDIPAIFDFDGDGDMDILTFAVSGSKVELHLNTSMETTGICGIEGYELRNSCYGRFVEGTESNTISTDYETVADICSFNVIDPRSHNLPNQTGGSRHVGSTILAFDATADDLVDIVLGDVTFPNMTYLENSDRGPLPDSVVYINPTFPSDFSNTPVNIDNFAAGYYEDIDGDGIRDLIVSVNNFSGSANKASIWHYKNTGLDNLPFFVLEQDNFLQSETMDEGEGSAPSFFDYNGDGLLDMVLATRGEYLESINFEPRLSLYLNNGTATAPAFIAINDDWLDVSALGIGQHPHPAFGDVDGDGDPDLVIGDETGVLHFFENTASPGSVANFIPSGLLANSAGTAIDVGQNATPFLYDVTDNGLLDLIVGERNGNVNYYQNTGSSINYAFTLTDETWGDINTVESGIFIGNSAPFLTVQDGVTYLLSGSQGGHIFQYIVESPTVLTLVSQTAFGISAGARSRVWQGDLNADNLADIVLGGIGGGFELFMGVGPDSDGLRSATRDALKLFPNPASDRVFFSLDEAIGSAPTQFELYQLDGRKVRSGLSTGEIDLEGLAVGVYVLVLRNNGRNFRGKLVKNKP